MAACLFGSLSHIPFLSGRARQYSMQCIGVDTMLLGLLVIAPLAQVAPAEWVQVLAGCMSAALLLQVVHFRRLAQCLAASWSQAHRVSSAVRWSHDSRAADGRWQVSPAWSWHRWSR